MNKKILLVLCSICLLFTSCGSKYDYKSVDGDPLNARIYTLPNGLKVYMTVNKETPRIQTYIAVRVGSKNDPAQTTGLAHYFEHLMFKGTELFGTSNYEAEKPLLDKITELFEQYRQTEDQALRTAIYHQIDSVSQEASKYAIPNEYDKLMAAIGAKGTNAWTSYDETVYTEDIPANEIENWAKIQSDRFENNVIRGFHTELETVYEEFNMSLTSDGNKVMEAILAQFFPNHPYGQHSVLGKQDHLKNPSIINIKNYYDTWYVPNNIAICLSGDFDPDVMIETIDRYFGTLEPNPNLPTIDIKPGDFLQEAKELEVKGLEAENVSISWRLSNPQDADYPINTILGYLLSNGKAGLMDIDINQAQKALWVNGGILNLGEAAGLFLMGAPKQGQSLEEVRDLILAEIAKIRNGDFDESLLKSIVNNVELEQMRQMENNGRRAVKFVDAFIAGIPWQQIVDNNNRISTITKQDVVDYANKYLGENSYVCVYKREGTDDSVKKIDKPHITPIQTNRDEVSQFLKDIQSSEVKPIEPVFVDFEKDLQKTVLAPGVDMVYTTNTLNKTFNLSFNYNIGTSTDPLLDVLSNYLPYLGTSTLSAAELQKAFYDLACDYDIYFGLDKTTILVSGLSDNMDKALNLLNQLLTDAQVNLPAYQQLVLDIEKSRNDSKLDQMACFSALNNYAIYGPQYVQKSVISIGDLKKIDPAILTAKLKEFSAMEHIVLCYAPQSMEEALRIVKENRPLAENIAQLDKTILYPYIPAAENIIYMAHYDAKQIYLSGISTREKEYYDASINPVSMLYNEYFGGGMNAIVFQEMREARGLAYSASARLQVPNRLDREYQFRSMIATQNDKMMDALNAFDMIINDMPESEAALGLAKDAILARLRTERYSGNSLLNYYLNMSQLGQTKDLRQAAFETIPQMTMADVKAFQEKWIKDRKYHYVILGDENDLDLNGLKQYGRIVMLSQKDIFGY